MWLLKFVYEQVGNQKFKYIIWLGQAFRICFTKRHSLHYQVPTCRRINIHAEYGNGTCTYLGISMCHVHMYEYLEYRCRHERLIYPVNCFRSAQIVTAKEFSINWNHDIVSFSYMIHPILIIYTQPTQFIRMSLYY